MMGKVFLVMALTLPLAIKLMYDGQSVFDPADVLEQRVLLTGASSGIGEELAYQFAKLGARLVITARRTDLLRNVSRKCRELGARDVHFVPADMAAPGDRSKVIERVHKHLGGLDYLVLNHAIITEGWWLGNAENLTYLEHVHRVNFLSYVDMASKALPMLTASRGRIGVVSSGLGEFGCVLATIYSSAKFALHGFFSSLRQELHHNNSGVTVTLAVLGPVASDAFIGLKNASAVKHVPSSYLTSPSAAARAILEGVVQRLYKTYFAGDMTIFSVLNAICPNYMEESFSRVLMNDDGTWLSYLVLLAWRHVY